MWYCLTHKSTSVKWLIKCQKQGTSFVCTSFRMIFIFFNLKSIFLFYNQGKLNSLVMKSDVDSDHMIKVTYDISFLFFLFGYYFTFHMLETFSVWSAVWWDALTSSLWAQHRRYALSLLSDLSCLSDMGDIIQKHFQPTSKGEVLILLLYLRYLSDLMIGILW